MAPGAYSCIPHEPTAACATGRLRAISLSCARSLSTWSPETGAPKPAYVVGARRLPGTTPTCSRSSHAKLMREPWPGVVEIVGVAAGSGVGVARAHIGYGKFPAPPANFNATLEVQEMYWQYQGYKQGKIPLPHMCYFLLTMLEENFNRQSSSNRSPSNKRKAASAKWMIALDFLSAVGNLTAKKGGLSLERLRAGTTS